MLVLILTIFVATAAGEPQSCDEYCALLLSDKIGRAGSGICNCHPQSEDKESESTRRNLETNPIYYEPVEFHPLPEVSFVYQPFVISNPTLAHKASARNEINQQSERHRKYKRKHDIIHKISIDTDRQPLYLDIDIKNSPSQSRSSQTHIIEVDNLHKTEQDLKDCIDLHLLVHFRRNGGGEIPNAENLKKYFYISDADLITELNDRCKKPSNSVEQSLRQIKEKLNEMKNSAFNSSGTEYLNSKLVRSEENVYKSHENEMLGSSTSTIPQKVPSIGLFYNNEDKISTTTMINQNNNYNERERNLSSDTIDSKLSENYSFTISRIDNLPEVSTAWPTLLKLNNNDNVEFHKEIQIEDKISTTHVPSKLIAIDNLTDSINNNINFRAAFSESKLKHNTTKSFFNTTALEEGNLMANTESSHSNVNETTDTIQFDDIVANTGEILTKTSTFTSIISNYTNENSNNNDSSIKTRDDVSSTTQTSLTNIYFGSILNENVSKKSINILKERDGKFENKDQEQTSNYAQYTLIKNRNAYELPSNSHYALNELTQESYIKENVLSSSEGNTHDSLSQTADTHFVNKLTLGRDLLGADLTEKPNTDSTYTSLFTSTTEQSHFLDTYENRKIITENKIQIPRIIVTEYSNDTVGSTVDGTEELPSNDFMTTDFDLDVADLPIGSVTTLSYKNHKSKQDENKKTFSDLDLITNKHNHGKNVENSHSNEISGKLYFIFRKHLIPMRFVQALDGKLNLSIDGESFCKKLLIDGKNNGIISTLCNSAVYNNNNCTKY